MCGCALSLLSLLGEKDCNEPGENQRQGLTEKAACTIRNSVANFMHSPGM